MTKKIVYDLVALGNTLLDYSAEVDETFLKKFDLKKGDWTSIKDSTQEKIEKNLEGRLKKTLGGSAANVVSGVNNLGGLTAYCGSVGKDENASLYKQIMKKEGIKTFLTKKCGKTGIALTLITPDSERSFAVNMGASANLKPRNLPKKALKNCKYFHTTGYNLTQKPEIALKAMKIVKKGGAKISFDVSSPRLIEENKELICEVLKEHVDIIFANEEEAKALTSAEPEKAVDELARLCETAIVKLGSKGALIKSKQEFHKVPAFDVNVVNTNGAGDGFAAGFLYGICNGFSLLGASLAGSIYAAKIVQQEGARLEQKSQADEIEAKIMVENFENIREKLHSLGAKYVGGIDETNYLLDKNGILGNAGEALRMRRETTGYRVTFKGKIKDSKLKVRPEFETTLRGFYTILHNLNKSGFEEASQYTKLRTPYKVGNVEVVLDTLLGKYNFVEIEGPTEEKVFEMIKKLDLEGKKLIKESYAELFKEF